MYLASAPTIATDRCVRINVSCHDYGGNKLTVKQAKNLLTINNKWNLMDCDAFPDLVIFYTSHNLYKEVCQEIMQQRIKHGFSCFLLLVTGESINFCFLGVDHSISYKPDMQNNYYLPDLVNSAEFQQLLYNKIPGSILNSRKMFKKSFCNFIYSNEASTKRFPGVKERKNFCKLLSQYKRIDCAGVSLNNTDKLKVIDESIENSWAAKLQFMRDYKFTIAFENQSIEGYITEKIWHAYLSGTIPIYWGSPNIVKFFNPESFVNCHDYGSFAEVIDRVKEIDNDIELFDRYINAAPILDDSDFHGFTKDKISLRMDAIMEGVVNKIKSGRQSKYPCLYEIRMCLEFIFTSRSITSMNDIRKYIKRRLINRIKSIIPKSIKIG